MLKAFVKSMKHLEWLVKFSSLFKNNSNICDLILCSPICSKTGLLIGNFCFKLILPPLEFCLCATPMRWPCICCSLMCRLSLGLVWKLIGSSFSGPPPSLKKRWPKQNLDIFQPGLLTSYRGHYLFLLQSMHHYMLSLLNQPSLLLLYIMSILHLHTHSPSIVICSILLFGSFDGTNSIVHLSLEQGIESKLHFVNVKYSAFHGFPQLLCRVPVISLLCMNDSPEFSFPLKTGMSILLLQSYWIIHSLDIAVPNWWKG